MALAVGAVHFALAQLLAVGVLVVLDHEVRGVSKDRLEVGVATAAARALSVVRHVAEAPDAVVLSALEARTAAAFLDPRRGGRLARGEVVASVDADVAVRREDAWLGCCRPQQSCSCSGEPIGPHHDQSERPMQDEKTNERILDGGARGVIGASQ